MSKLSSNTIGILLAITGVILFSAKAVMVKMAYTFNIDSLSLLVFRMAFAFPFYIGIALWKKPEQSANIKPKDYYWLIVFGLLGYYLASFFDFEGLQYLKAGLERIILFTYPTLVAILAWIFFRKKLNKPQLIAIAITYVGILITFWNELEVEPTHEVLKGSLLIFLSAFTYACYLVGSGWLIPKFGTLAFTAYAMIVSSLGIFIHYAFAGDFDLFNYPWQIYALGFSMAIFSTLIPSFIVSEAIKRLGANAFSVIGSLGPVSTIIMAYFFLNEKITLIQFIGMVIVILGVSFISKKGK